VVPVEESLLFIQPIYLRGEGVLLPEFKRVVVVFGEKTPPIMRETLDAALAEIFGESAAPSVPDVAPDETDRPRVEPSDDLASLIVEVDRLLDEANEALRSGDLGGYQAKVDEATRLVGRLGQLVEASSN